MKQRRVVITGIGLVSSLGRSVDEFGEALFAGRSAIVPLQGWDIEDSRYRLGGQIVDFDFAQELPDVDAKRLLRYTRFALVAADRAVRDAALPLDQINRRRVGTSFGTAAGSTGEGAVTEVRRFLAKGDKGVSPLAYMELSWGACTTHVALHFKLQGPLATHSSGCVSSVDTILWGAQQIRNNLSDIMIVGGTDTPFYPFTWSMMCRSGILAPAPEDGGSIPRPFSDDHSGIALLEGASALVLESEESARLRGAHIYGELLGGTSINSGMDGFDTEEMARIFAQVIGKSLQEAGVPPASVDWVCAHGTGHRLGDYAESYGIELGLGAHAFRVPVSSIRGALGQSFASGGGYQVASACLAIQRQQVPPTINFSRPAEGCRLDYVPNVARVARVKNVLINGAGFGGIHSGLVVSDYSG